jgi:hypothetical protein
MRDKQLKQVISHTTGNAEADMLGNILLFVERTNRPGPHRSHRKRTVRMSIKSKLRVASKRTWKALNEILRKWKTIPGKGKDDTPKYLSGLRKNKRNGN